MIKIAIVGTGGMANAHANEFKKIKGCQLVAACDVVRKQAEDFAAKHGIPAVYGDFGKLLAETDCDAVSNVTPDAFHASLSLKAIAAGRHVLCEKPLAVNYADARKMADAARRKGVINMVNFSYRNSSAIHKAHKMVAAGEIGRVMHVEASYLQGWLVGRHWGDWKTGPGWLWRLSKAHGSKGVLGDIGVHIVDFATYPVGDVKTVNCRLKTFPKVPGNRLGEYRLDANDSAVLTVEFAGGAIGTIHTTRWATGQPNSLRLRIYGDKGAIIVDLDKDWGALDVCLGKDVHTNTWKRVSTGKTPNMYQRFITSIRTGKNDQPDFARGAAIQKILDACFVSDKKSRPVRM
ncbi:MAG: Gfo/Idh/MocA family oxidoreductase [Planctomycetes bacterium]|nr:Gfo/Idh/MocA family oxidoreductase [Planctomycetota bacterium]